MDNRGSKTGKKRSKSGASEVKSLKSTGPGSKVARQKAKKEIKRRVKAIDRVDEDSDLDEALKPGYVLHAVRDRAYASENFQKMRMRRRLSRSRMSPRAKARDQQRES